MWEIPKRDPIAKSPVSVLLLGNANGMLATTVEGLRKKLAQPLGEPEFFWIGGESTELPSEVPVTRIAVDSATGLGPAIQAAVAQSRHPILLMVPADWPIDENAITEFLRLIDTMDLVVGARVTRPIPWWRRTLDWVQIWSAWLLLGLEFEPRKTWFGSLGWRRRKAARWFFSLYFEDPESPLRMVRREILRQVPLQSKGSFVLVEMLAKTNHLEALLAETPVAWSTRLALEGWETDWAADARKLFTQPEFAANRLYPEVPIPPQNPMAEAVATSTESEAVSPTISPSVPSIP